MIISTGKRFRYKTPPQDAVTVTSVDAYSVAYVGPNGLASMSRSLFEDMFEEIPDSPKA